MDNQENEDLELQNELEYFQLNGDFFEEQTEMWTKLIYKQELRDLDSLKEEQELIDKFNERKIEKEKLISHLRALKDQLNEKEVKKYDTVLIRINGFFNCSECPHKTKRKSDLKLHIKAIHLKIKPWKCLECHKGWLPI